ncbi:MAG: PAS domain S-box protein [Hyphomonas sp.]|uniref:PAS domain-containing protein n=1 Tax=Hyphomonas sp. TaxID=87 RepID=UPI00179D550C|nr:PAS domain-containing protein [Hyphomonas sp.]MBA3067898.1 PAS domain S-box protein [Hyphomonas sp.]MBU4062454.1 PAS domain-containing protein [Alphaproteobacteria bacterium]MBU4165937.1 PAS domain-containing protein [Alphaproteobacteria bacterium]
MFRAFSGKTPEGSEGYFQAIMRSQAVIEFKPDGTILTANENFLSAMGYTLSEIVGRQHSMFAAPDYAASSAYRTFWERLNRGEFVADKFLRLGKGGKEVWIQGSYNPVADKTGKVVKVVKFATDITEQEQVARAAVFKGAAFDTSPVPMIVSDREFKIAYVNGSLVKMLKDNLDNFRAVFPNFNPCPSSGILRQKAA